MIQPYSPSDPGAMCGNVYDEYFVFCDRLRKLHYMSTRSWALIPAAQCSRSISEDKDMALQDWRDRLNGGEGCWRMDEEWLVRIQPQWLGILDGDTLAYIASI